MLFGDDINYVQSGGYELITKEQNIDLSKMQEINDMLRPYFNEDVYVIANDQIESQGFERENVTCLILNKFEGALHTGKLIKRLILEVQKRGCLIFTGAQVTGYGGK